MKGEGDMKSGRENEKESESSHAVQAIGSDDEEDKTKEGRKIPCLSFSGWKGSNFHHFHLNETHPFITKMEFIH